MICGSKRFESKLQFANEVSITWGNHCTMPTIGVQINYLCSVFHSVQTREPAIHYYLCSNSFFNKNACHIKTQDACQIIAFGPTVSNIFMKWLVGNSMTSPLKHESIIRVCVALLCLERCRKTPTIFPHWNCTFEWSTIQLLTDFNLFYLNGSNELTYRYWQIDEQQQKMWPNESRIHDGMELKLHVLLRYDKMIHWLNCPNSKFYESE